MKRLGVIMDSQSRRDAMADAETFAEFVAVYGDASTRGLSAHWWRMFCGWVCEQFWWHALSINAARAAFAAVPGLKGEEEFYDVQ